MTTAHDALWTTSIFRFSTYEYNLNLLNQSKHVFNDICDSKINLYMIDSHRRPLLKSASTAGRHYLKSRSNFRIFSNRRPFQSRISIGPFTGSKFAIKNKCNDSFVLRVFFICILKLLFFVLCVFKAFSHSLILFRVKVRFRVRVKVRVMVMVRYG